LKNALDVGSRPYGKNVWSGKPGAIISQSPGGIGGFGANHHLRQVLAFLNVLTLAQPEAYIGSYHTLIDENGMLSNTDTKEFINSFLDAFAAWVEKLS
jgi:chromate reductase